MFGLLAAKAIPWKMIGMGILIVVIGILIAIHISNDNDVKNKVTELQGHIVQLEIDKSKLKDSNASLEVEIGRLVTEKNSIVDEFQTLQTVDRAAQTELDEFRKIRRSRERKDRVDRLISTKRRTLLLRMANSAAKCETEHFEDYTGVCVIGRWKPNE